MFIKATCAMLVAGMVVLTLPAAAHARDLMQQASLGGSLTAGQDRASASMRIFDETRPPIGYLQFCQRHREECRGGTAEPRMAQLTPERWAELNQINLQINLSVKPVTDAELYKTAEYWTYPQGSGDCEDYVLLKRRMLAERGWPIEALLITVVIDEAGDGHAVLTVVTDHGDFVLDNKHQAILLWNEAPYEYRKRQSMTHPSIWVSLSPASSWFENVMPASPR